MHWNRLTRGDQVVVAGGVVLVVASVFPWLGARITRIAGKTQGVGNHYSFTHNAWGYTVTLIAVLLGIALLVYEVLKLLGLDVPDRFGPLSAGQVMLSLGTMSLVLVLTKVAVGSRVELASFGLPNLPSGLGKVLGLSVQKTRSLASFVGLGAATGLFLGGLLKLREDHPATRSG
jgi:hypothetical protein